MASNSLRLPIKDDAISAATSNITQTDNSSPFLGSGLTDFALSPYVLLPDSFGDIYVGESFTCYATVINGSDKVPLQNVSAQLHLLTKDGTYELQSVYGSQDVSNAQHVPPHGYVDFVVSSMLAEQGSHTLRINIQYSVPEGPAGQQTLTVKTLRKMYKFTVTAPFQIITACKPVVLAQSTSPGGEGVYARHVAIQAHVSNKSEKTILIENAVFLPVVPEACGVAIESDLITTADTSCISLNAKQSRILAAGDEYAFAFMYSVPSEAQNSNPDSTATALGHVEVTWSVNMGERGVLASNLIALPTGSDNNSDNIRVELITCARTVNRGQVVPATFRLVGSPAVQYVPGMSDAVSLDFAEVVA